jgi:eukaryotic-like serine/threonine-protein kinase
VDAFGRCQPGFGQGRFRADRFDDGAYDIDTGECNSNLVGDEALLEIYFPVGGLDASRGVTRGPDAIIDSRSAPPGVPIVYTYELPALGSGPFVAEARLIFRAFPPFLVRAFADYEALQAARGLRPSGPLVTHGMLDRLEAIELHRVRVEIP